MRPILESRRASSLASPRWFGTTHTRADLEAGARRQPPCIDICHLEQTIYDRWDSLQSLGLVPRSDQPPPNVVSFDLLAAELERAGRTRPDSS